ncbi:MAG: hypothetical protein KF844_01045 [Cryobacterium sp.]|nr:hypothetical protein [Cryobacterium sp.]
MNTEVGFLTASIALRPPRIAILVASDDHWRDWAMIALRTASDYWGGAGFIIVPYDTNSGTVAPEFAEIVRTYDPDHVVTLPLPPKQWEAWQPGYFRAEGVEAEEQRLQLLASTHFEFDDPAAKIARNEVAGWCSPMRGMRLTTDEAERQMEVVTSLKPRTAAGEARGFRTGLTPAPHPLSGARIAASEAWRSDFGLMAAMRAGVANAELEDRPEPTDGLEWFINPVGDAPTSLIWANQGVPTIASTDLPLWFLADQGLAQWAHGLRRDRIAVVVGDTARDFALALAYDRLIGHGIWLPTAMLDDVDTFRKNVHPTLSTIISGLENRGDRMIVTSTSANPDCITDLVKAIREPYFTVRINGSQIHRRDETVEARLPDLSSGSVSYLANEHVGANISIPVSRAPDGTREALTGLETPIPTNPVHDPNSEWMPYWLVDVALAGDSTPRARDLPGDILAVADGAFSSVNLRATRDGITFDPHSMGLVLAGSPLSGRIGRPRLRSLSMLAWIEAMAKPAGLGVRLSSAGRLGELVRRRLGTRGDLLDLIKTENLPLLRAFTPMEKQPKTRDPDMVVLNDLDPYLSIEGIDTRFSGDLSDAVALVDRLTAARLLRRGLILDCDECGRPSFYDADHVAQRFDCSQCGASNELTSERWRKTAEPRWFYDLYTAFRELFRAHGDIPLLAAAYLRSESRHSYNDAPELEFFEVKTGKVIAEIDLISCADGKLSVVEAKSNGTFGGTKRVAQTKKLLRIANVLRADQIVLATTNDRFNVTDVRHAETECAKVMPFGLNLEVLTSLG